MNFRDLRETHRPADDQRDTIVFRRSIEKRLEVFLVRKRSKLVNELPEFLLCCATVLVVVQRCIEPKQIQRFKVTLIRHRQPVDSLSSARRMAKRKKSFVVSTNSTST